MDKIGLVARWDAHMGAELFAKDADATMDTMTANPYVNHVPTMTGGVGAAELRRFYKYHFIPCLPDDLEIVPVSRTVGDDTVVEELVARFTHSVRMDYLLPGVAPTYRRIELPLVVIAHFQDGKLAHEHIYWDQASVLVQAGLLEPGDLPIAGVEVAQKVIDPERPSNRLMFREWMESEDKSAGSPSSAAGRCVS
jgi:carboxymethylenebutenolidase